MRQFVEEHHGRRLDQFIRGGERVIYRTPGNRFSGLGFFGIGVVIGTLGALTHPDKTTLTTFLAFLCLMVALRAIALLQRELLIEAAVTERRVLQVEGEGELLELTEIMVDDVQVVEILHHAVRVTTTHGRTVVLDRLESAADLGPALARAAGLRPPRVPEAGERLAEEVVILAGWAAGALAYAVVLRSQDVEQLLTLSDPSYLSALLLSVGAGVTGWLLGTLCGLVLLRPFFTLAGMRAWMWQAELFTPGPKAPNRTGPFTRFCLWFVDLLYGPPADPPGQGDTGHGG